MKPRPYEQFKSPVQERTKTDAPPIPDILTYNKEKEGYYLVGQIFGKLIDGYMANLSIANIDWVSERLPLAPRGGGENYSRVFEKLHSRLQDSEKLFLKSEKTVAEYAVSCALRNGDPCFVKEFIGKLDSFECDHPAPGVFIIKIDEGDKNVLRQYNLSFNEDCGGIMVPAGREYGSGISFVQRRDGMDKTIRHELYHMVDEMADFSGIKHVLYKEKYDKGFHLFKNEVCARLVSGEAYQIDGPILERLVQDKEMCERGKEDIYKTMAMVHVGVILADRLNIHHRTLLYPIFCSRSYEECRITIRDLFADIINHNQQSLIDVYPCVQGVWKGEGGINECVQSILRELNIDNNQDTFQRMASQALADSNIKTLGKLHAQWNDVQEFVVQFGSVLESPQQSMARAIGRRVPFYGDSMINFLTIFWHTPSSLWNDFPLDCRSPHELAEYDFERRKANPYHQEDWKFWDRLYNECPQMTKEMKERLKKMFEEKYDKELMSPPKVQVNEGRSD